MKLQDKVAIVTGAASGIGAASAQAMAAEGARVLVVDLNETGAKSTAAAIERDRGTAMAMAADVTRAADNQAMVERAVAAWGRLDVFYANAGVPQWKTDVEEVEEKTFDTIFDVNVKGVYLGAIGGAGAVLSRFVRKVDIVAYEDLGTEAIRRIEVEKFPAIVINDCHGGDLYQDGMKQYARE